jgi:hypothetical protein
MKSEYILQNCVKLSPSPTIAIATNYNHHSQNNYYSWWGDTDCEVLLEPRVEEEGTKAPQAQYRT